MHTYDLCSHTLQAVSSVRGRTMHQYTQKCTSPHKVNCCCVVSTTSDVCYSNHNLFSQRNYIMSLCSCGITSSITITMYPVIVVHCQLLQPSFMVLPVMTSNCMVVACTGTYMYDTCVILHEYNNCSVQYMKTFHLTFSEACRVNFVFINAEYPDTRSSYIAAHGNVHYLRCP